MKKNILKILKKNKIKDEEENIIVDSLEFIRLIVDLEESYKIKFDDEDFIFENFSSINRIIEIIKKRKLLNYKNYLNQKIKVKVDRKLGDKHPEYEYIYSLNYGYIPNTESEDGEEIDVYILGEFDPLEEFEGVCRAIIYRVDDIENKLIVTAEDKKYSIDQIKALVEFQERFFKTEIIMEK